MPPKTTLSVAAALVLAALALPAAAPAQTGTGSGTGTETVQIATAESPAYGRYLTDGAGRPLYLFTADTQGRAGSGAAVACTSADCLAAWPPFTTGDPADPTTAAGAGADQALIGTIAWQDGRRIVTYNGWPLYYFVRDEGADSPQGQDIDVVVLTAARLGRARLIDNVQCRATGELSP